MKKVYAKTLNPEFFDYRIYDIRDDEGNEVIIDGGREFPDIDNKGYLDSIKKIMSNYYCYSSIKECLEDYLPAKENKKALSPREIGEIHEALKWMEGSSSAYEENVILTCLKVITGKEWKKKILRGCMQSEWAKCYYPVDTKQSYIDYVEAWFFGTGTEIEVDDSNNEDIQIPEDIEGFTFYTANWKVEDIKQEIASYFGGDVEVVLWLYDTTRIIKHDLYKLAD